MKTFKYICHVVAIGYLLLLQSCLSYKQPDLSSYETYQISNTSAAPITLRFYEQSKPKNIYAEIWDGDRTLDLTIDNNMQSCENLFVDTMLTLNMGQTALFYLYGNDIRYRDKANSLLSVGDGTTCTIFCHCHSMFGDSIVFSVNNGEWEKLSVEQGNLWETWYDRKKYIYYHCLNLK